MASDLANFGLSEMLRTSGAIHRAAASAPTMESCARRICRALYNELVDPDGARACALVRCYKTHEFGDLPYDLQRFAQRTLESVRPPVSSMRCLTLLATAGEQPAWNSRRLSRGHQAIPLPSAQIVERAPMITQLVKDFGLQLSDIVNPTPDVVRNLSGKTYDIFHVEEARGSQSIPAQDEFVVRHGVRSVVGFGGSLTSGNLYAVILFSRVPVSRASADRFRTIALDVKTLFFGFSEEQIFDIGGQDTAEGEQPLRA